MIQNPVVFLFVILALVAVIIVLLMALLRKHAKPDTEIPALEEASKYLLVDPDSGVYNKSFFHKKLEEEIYRAARYGSQFSLAIFNLENVCKEIEENHLPTLLRKLGVTISKDTRFIDIVARTNRCQLTLLFPMTPKRASEVSVARLMVKIKEILQAENLPTEFETRLFGFPEDKVEIEKLSRILKEG